jgi:hypothetical protein
MVDKQCSLFNNTLIGSDFIASNIMTTSKKEIGTDLDGNGCGLLC